MKRNIIASVHAAMVYGIAFMDQVTTEDRDELMRSSSSLIDALERRGKGRTIRSRRSRAIHDASNPSAYSSVT